MQASSSRNANGKGAGPGSCLIRFEFVEYFRGGFSVGLIRSRVKAVLIRAVGIATPAETFFTCPESWKCFFLSVCFSF